MENEGLIQNLDKEIEILENSPLFHLSLGSKELFHSNFLEMIFTEGDKGKEFCKDLLGIKGEILGVFREKHNFDLLVVYEIDKEYKGVAIENKFKSLPYKEQLEKLSDKCKKKIKLKPEELLTVEIDPKKKVSVNKKILLSPHKLPARVDPKEWEHIDYKDYLTKLKEIKLDRLGELIKDYINFTEALLTIINNIEKNISLKTKIKDLNNSKSRLKRLRILDLYQKVTYSYALKMIVEDLGLKDLEMRIPRTGDEKAGVYQSINYTRGCALFELIFAFDEVQYLIQFQGESLKLMVHRENLNEKETILEKQEEILFDFKACNLNTNGKVYPTSKSQKFNKYKSNIKYKNVKLDENTSLEDISNFCRKKMKQIKQPEFKNAISALK